MRVYVVFGYWSYEGNDEPLAVCSTRKIANREKKAAKETTHYSGIDIKSYKIIEE